MPRGQYDRSKSKEIPKVEIPIQAPTVTKKVARFIEEIPHVEEKKEEIKKAVNVLMRPCGCCKVDMPPALPGQKYFEVPADGHIIIAEETTNQVWDRRGKGGWVNPKR